MDLNVIDLKKEVKLGRVDDKIVGGGKGNLLRYDVVSDTLNKYNVSFAYKLGKFPLRKIKKFNSEYDGVNEVQVYLVALNDLYNMVDFRKVDIKQASINITTLRTRFLMNTNQRK